MNNSKKRKENNLRWIILLSVILIFLFLTLDLIFTGYVIDNPENPACKMEWGVCPNGNSDCCSGLECLGGTCKIGEPPIEAKIFIEEDEEQTQCLEVNQQCTLDLECCSELDCVVGSCQDKKVICIDSDGGKNPYLNGYISGISVSKEYFFNLKDECVSEQETKEAYCEDSFVTFENSFCPNGCMEGICNCKYAEQFCNYSLECCEGFNCVNNTCILQGEEFPASLNNRAICTFIGYPCELNYECCSKNCVPNWEFLFWKSDTKKCGLAKLERN